MKLAGLVILIPTLAAAQPTYTPPPPPAVPPPVTYSPDAAQPGGPPGMTQPGDPGQPAYYQPPVINPPPSHWRHGFTFEGGLGLGVGWAKADNETSDSQGGLSVAFGLGGWLNDHLALTARLQESVFQLDDNVSLYHAFFGPSLQYWTDDHLWLSGGIGWAFLGTTTDDSDNDPDPISGLGLDLRLGYNFTTSSPNTFHVAAELTPGFFREDNVSGDFTMYVFSVMIGYQHW